MKTKFLKLIALFSLGFAIVSCQAPKSEDTAKTAETKAMVEKVNMAFQSGTPDALDEVLADDFKTNSPDPMLPGDGKDHMKAQILAYHGANPDMKVTIHKTIAEGDLVTCYYSVAGTNTGNMGEFPATGKAFDVEGVDIFRIANGKIAEHWGLFDNYKMMDQLGMFADHSHDTGNPTEAAPTQEKK